MRFLLKDEWDTFNNINDSKNMTLILIGIPISRRTGIMEEIYSEIAHLVTSKKFGNEIMGIAMTLFHYYTYFKNLKDIDPLELSVACVYLACKIQFFYIPMDQVVDMYNVIRKEKNDSSKKKNPDFIRYEIEIYSFLGYDLDIETPYNWYYKLVCAKKWEIFKKDDFKNLLFNLINDMYRSPLCIHYHPKVIMISAVIMISKFNELSDVDFDSLLSEEKKEDIIACMTQTYALFEELAKIDNNNNTNNNTNSNANSNSNSISNK